MKGMSIEQNHLKGTDCKIQLFNGSRWNIRNNKAYQYTLYFEGKEPLEVEYRVEEIATIFPQIKIVFDKKKRIIATRLNKNCRLLTTCADNFFSRITRKKVKKPSKIELKVYKQLVIEKKFA